MSNSKVLTGTELTFLFLRWLGITEGIHGYDEIDIADKVSVRSEVARLTRLYETAVKKYKANNPDSYNSGAGPQGPITGLRARPPGHMPPAEGSTHDGGPAPLNLVDDSSDEDDESPATAKDKTKFEDKDKAKGKAAEAPQSPATAKDAKKDPAAPTAASAAPTAASATPAAPKDATTKPATAPTQPGSATAPPPSGGPPKDASKEAPKPPTTGSTPATTTPK